MKEDDLVALLVSEWPGFGFKLNDEQSDILRTLIRHSLDIYRKCKDLELLRKVFVYVGWLDVEIAKEIITLIDDINMKYSCRSIVLSASNEQGKTALHSWNH